MTDIEQRKKWKEIKIDHLIKEFQDMHKKVAASIVASEFYLVYDVFIVFDRYLDLVCRRFNRQLGLQFVDQSLLDLSLIGHVHLIVNCLDAPQGLEAHDDPQLIIEAEDGP